MHYRDHVVPELKLEADAALRRISKLLKTECAYDEEADKIVKLRLVRR